MEAYLEISLNQYEAPPRNKNLNISWLCKKNRQ
jgi:hypothetical protein